MIGEPSNRSAELILVAGKLEVQQNDYCEAFEQEVKRLFFGKECWYCKYGDFGISSEHPTIIGVCKYKDIKAASENMKDMNRNRQ